MGWAGRNFDAGKARHVWVVWCVSVLVPALLVALLYLGVSHYSLLLAVAFDVAVLYFTLGFRQFSHYFTDMREALDRGDEDEVRRLLAEWLHLDASELPRTEVLRHVVEHALLAAHRHVFGVFFWFIVLLGARPRARPARCSTAWPSSPAATGPIASARSTRPPTSGCCRCRSSVFGWVDLVPARLTAFGFAVVGNFEEAVNGWRRDAGLWQQPNEGIILAAAAGAVGVQLGGACRARRDARPLQDLQRRRCRPARPAPRARPPACRCSRATCKAWSGWCGARWCCGCCCWRC